MNETLALTYNEAIIWSKTVTGDIVMIEWKKKNNLDFAPRSSDVTKSLIWLYKHACINV